MSVFGHLFHREIGPGFLIAHLADHVVVDTHAILMHKQIEAESVETRDRWFTPDDEPSEEQKQFNEAHPENVEWFKKLDTLVSGFGVTYTDYVELD